ncbi:MAG TPA: Hsp20/alpha crystallin family protein [Bryobacteraceae bacterium]|jgi:HSP20 family protein|nr:Hsp20/alpha crystallin family protein [Bryobacteraceae bacterium]
MSTTAVTFDPFNGFRLFEDYGARLMSEPRGNRPWSPSVDIFESEDALTLKADLPDVKIEDIDVQVEHQTLTLRGQRKFTKDENVKGYHRIERSYGEFVRSFGVPSTVDTEKVQADYKNGVLTITLPKKEAAKPRQVKVAVQDGEAKVQ